MTGCILGIAADLPREGMRDVDKKLDLLITAMGCKTFGTSENSRSTCTRYFIISRSSKTSTSSVRLTRFTGSIRLDDR